MKHYLYFYTLDITLTLILTLLLLISVYSSNLNYLAINPPSRIQQL